MSRTLSLIAVVFCLLVPVSLAGTCDGVQGAPGDVDGDGVLNGVDCAPDDPSQSSTPAEARGLQIDNGSLVSWDATAQTSSYNLHRSSGPTVNTFECEASELVEPAFTDAQDPQAGQAFYYLAQGRNDCGGGDVGTDSSGTPRPQLSCDCSTLCDDGDACTQSVCSNGQCTNVAIEPLILLAPQDATACAGLGANFHVQASGSGALSYQWYVDGSPAGANLPTLILSSLGIADDAAQITVEVTDGCSTATAGPATLSVFAAQSSCFGGLDEFEPPNQGYNGRPPLRLATGATVSVAFHSGETVIGSTDLRVRGRGDFVWERTYRSREPNESAQGRNWVHSYARRIEWLNNPGGPILLHDGSAARIDVYQPDPQLQNCWTADGFFRTLCLQPDQRFVLTFADKHEWIFRPLNAPPFDGQIEADVDRNGNAMFFQYDQTNRLDHIVDTLGRPYQLNYNPDGFIESLVDFTGRSVTYDYYEDGDAGGGAGDLKSVTTPSVVGTPTGNDFPNGKTTTYTYTTGFADDALNHNLLTITDPKEQTWIEFVYMATTLPADNRFDRLDHITLPNGEISFVYVDPPFDPQFPQVVSTTVVNDRAGNVTEYSFDSGARMVRALEYTGHADASLPTDLTTNRPGPPLRPTDPPFFETIVDHNVDSLPTFVHAPNGNVTQLQYDTPNPDPRFRANLLQRTRIAGPLGGDQGQITESWTYTTDFGTSSGPHVHFEVRRHNYASGDSVRSSGGDHRDNWGLKGGHGLHRDNVVHRDIAARNVLAAGEGVGGGTGSGMGSLFKHDDFVRFAAGGPGDTAARYTALRIAAGGPGDTAARYTALRIAAGGPGDTAARYTALRIAAGGPGDTAARYTALRIAAGGGGGGAGNGTATRHADPIIEWTFEKGWPCRYEGPRPCATGSSFPSTYTDGRGLQYVFTYDTTGNLDTATGPPVTTGVLGGGQQIVVHDFDYNAFGQLTQHLTPAGRVDRYTYYTNGPQTGYLQDAIVDFGGFDLTTTYEYDALGRVTRTIDPRGNDTQYVVNELDQVVRAVSSPPFLYETDLYYDANDNVVRIDLENVDENGVLDTNSHLSRTWEYDILDRVVREQTETDDGGACYAGELEYDANDNVTRQRKGEAANGSDPDNTVRMLYDERDLVFQVTRAEGTADQSTRQYDYDSNGNTTVVREGIEIPQDANVTTHTYDGYDRLTSTTDPEGNRALRNYDANGNVVRLEQDGEELQGSGLPPIRLFEEDLLYDELDRLVRTDTHHYDTAAPQAPIGDGFSTFEWFYAPDSRLIRAEDDNGFASIHLYDTARRSSEIVDAKGNSRRYVYDANSNVTVVTDVELSDLGSPPEFFTSTFTYDELNRATRTADNDGNEWDYDYDSRHNLRVGIDSLDNVVRREYDGADRVVRAVRELTTTGTGAGAPAGEIETLHCWDDSSRNTCLVDDNGNVTQYVYDSLDRRIRTDYADGSEDCVIWDIKDNGIEETDANGTVRVHTYDGLDRLVSTSVTPAAGVTGPLNESFDYDGLSRLVGAQNDDSVVTRTYDSLSNMTEETLRIGAGPVRATTMTYDGVGNCTSTHYPTGVFVQRTFDELDRCDQIVSNGTPAAVFSYFGPSRVERVDRAGNYRTDYGYDSLRRITRVHSHDTVTTLADHVYTYDAMDNTTSRTDQLQGGPARTFDYDSAYRLVRTTNSTAPTIDYTLDGPGNRTLVTGGPDAGTYTLSPGADFEMNQYSSTPRGVRSYDENGNLMLSTDLAGTTQYAYDYRDLMTQVTLPGPVTHSYTYDALGRRVARANTTTGAATRFYYDGVHVVEEQNQIDAESATYVYGPGYGNPLELRLVVAPGNDFNNLLYMDMAHVVAAQDATSLTLRERYRYGDYGEPEFLDTQNNPLPASGIENPYLFHGHRHDPESGFYFEGGSYMDPHAGRYTTRDPLGIWAGGSAFGNGATYASGNPWSNPGVRGGGDHNGNGELKVIIKAQKLAGHGDTGGNGEIKVIINTKKIAGHGDNGGNGEIKVIVKGKKLAGGSVDDGVIRDFNWTQLDGPYGTKKPGTGKYAGRIIAPWTSRVRVRPGWF